MILWANKAEKEHYKLQDSVLSDGVCISTKFQSSHILLCWDALLRCWWSASQSLCPTKWFDVYFSYGEGQFILHRSWDLPCRFDAVIHFAGLKAVGESCSKPLQYYINNVLGTLNLLDIMNSQNCKKVLLFSNLSRPPCILAVCLFPHFQPTLFDLFIERDVDLCFLSTVSPFTLFLM